VKAWSVDPDPAKRERIALALGRIGTATFDDTNGDGRRQDTETMAGVPEPKTLASDSVPDIRPAREAGLGAVFIPNAHTWVLEHDEVPADVLTLERFPDLLDHF